MTISSLNVLTINRMKKSRSMRRAGHVVHMGKMRSGYKVLVGKLEGKRHLEDLDIDGRIILKCILWK
jgi:hypothetical protein